MDSEVNNNTAFLKTMQKFESLENMHVEFLDFENRIASSESILQENKYYNKLRGILKLVLNLHSPLSDIFTKLFLLRLSGNWWTVLLKD